MKLVGYAVYHPGMDIRGWTRVQEHRGYTVKWALGYAAIFTG
jgi:hypothetical protein